MQRIFKRPYNLFLTALFVCASLFALFIFDFLKQEETRQFRHTHYSSVAQTMRTEIKTAIEQKQNATLTAAMALAKSNNLIQALTQNRPLNPSLKELSLHLKEHTSYKNVWLHLIDSNGTSVQRSWTQQTGDNLLGIRNDLKTLLRDPKITSSISVGKFDMSFKSMVPVYDSGSIAGIFEVITHFNSIDRYLRQRGYESVVLAHKRYKKQLAAPFTDTFVNDYYVANLDAKQSLLKLLADTGISAFTDSPKKYFVLEKHLLSVYTLPDASGRDMGYYLAFKPLSTIDTTTLENTHNILTFYTFAALLFLLLLYLLLLDKKTMTASLSNKTYKQRLLLMMGLGFLLFCAVFYMVYKDYTQTRIEHYLQESSQKTARLYRLSYHQHRQLAKSIFEMAINTTRVKQIVQDRHKDADAAREILRRHFEKRYEDYTKYGIKQLHFHLPDTQSFLRMHRPKRHSDFLNEVRGTVKQVAKTKKAVEGFEEGRIYNGYRFVFPLVQDQEYIASVETSFDMYALLKPLLKDFDYSAAFLINSDVVAEKVFAQEQNNYMPSPIEGFYFQKSLYHRLRGSDQHASFCQMSIDKFTQKTQNRQDAQPFSISICGMERIMTFIPLQNPVDKEVVGYTVLSSHSDYILSTRHTFYTVYFSILLLVLFLIIFIYRELVTRNALKRLNTNLENRIKTEVASNMKKDRLISQQAKLAAMGEMIGAIAHQWRQPLNALNINIQNLDDDYEEGLIDEKFINDFIAKQTKTIRFMSQTIDDFRNFFRVDKTKSEFSLYETIAETEGILQAQLRNHNISLHIDCGGDITLLGYKREFGQVLLNIINNAKDAILSRNIDRGRITVTCTPNTLEIADNAGGIDAAIMEKIFDPYFTTKDEKNGTGMGLYMSKMIIEQNMNERLSAYNGKEGAVFVITYENARIRS